MDNLKFFNDKQHYDSLKTNFKYPTVSWVNDEEKAYYVENTIDYSQEYFTIHAFEDGVIYFTVTTGIAQGWVNSFSYSKDKVNWTTTIIENTAGYDIEINVLSGEKVYFKGDASCYTYASNNTINVSPTARITVSASSSFNATCRHEVYGNIMSLFYEDNFIGKTTFPTTKPDIGVRVGGLFGEDELLVYAHNLILPTITLEPAIYYNMFYYCSALETAPTLPATTLSNACYSNMFRNCTSLTTAPILPATTLVMECYKFMFRDCANLNYIKAMFTTTPSTDYTSNWVSNVAASGTFVKNSTATWTTIGTNAVPSGWNILTAAE